MLPVGGILSMCVKPGMDPFGISLREALSGSLETAVPAPYPERPELICPVWGLGIKLPG